MHINFDVTKNVDTVKKSKAYYSDELTYQRRRLRMLHLDAFLDHMEGLHKPNFVARLFGAKGLHRMARRAILNVEDGFGFGDFSPFESKYVDEETVRSIVETENEISSVKDKIATCERALAHTTISVTPRELEILTKKR